MGFWIDLRILVENTTFTGNFFFKEFIFFSLMNFCTENVYLFFGRGIKVNQKPNIPSC